MTLSDKLFDNDKFLTKHHVKFFINQIKEMIDFEFKDTMSLGNHIIAEINKLAGEKLTQSNRSTK